MKSFLKPLSAKEEDDMLKQCKAGGREARDTLIEHNLRLVAHIAKKYSTADKEMDDLISIGTIGLIKAIDTFDTNKGIRLATYASRCIDNAILLCVTHMCKMHITPFLFLHEKIVIICTF